MRISDWSSDVCSSDLVDFRPRKPQRRQGDGQRAGRSVPFEVRLFQLAEVELIANRARHDQRLFRAEPEPALRRGHHRDIARGERSEEPTSELPSLMRISDAVFFLKKKNK